MATQGGTGAVLDMTGGGRFEQAVRDAGVEMLESGRSSLAHRAQIGDVEVIHEIRVCTKRLRALLCLVGKRLPADTLTELKRQAKTLADQLAGARDAQVALETLQAIIGNDARAEPAQRLIAFIQREQPEAEAAEVDPPDWTALDQSLDTMVQAWASLASPPILRRHLKRGLQSSFRRGREDWKASRDVTAIEPLHDWRKQVKRLYYQQQLLPGGSPKSSKQLKRLGDLLGLLHDIDMLNERLQQQRRYCWLEDLQWLRPRLQCRRQQHLDQALKLGRKIYADASAKGYVKALVDVSDEIGKG